MSELFEQEILSHIQPSDGEKAEAHHVFQLTAAKHGKFPIFMYVELDLDLWALLCQKSGFLLPRIPINFWIHATKPNCLV